MFISIHLKIIQSNKYTQRRQKNTDNPPRIFIWRHIGIFIPSLHLKIQTRFTYFKEEKKFQVKLNSLLKSLSLKLQKMLHIHNAWAMLLQKQAFEGAIKWLNAAYLIETHTEILIFLLCFLFLDLIPSNYWISCFSMVRLKMNSTASVFFFFSIFMAIQALNFVICRLQGTLF